MHPQIYAPPKPPFGRDKSPGLVSGSVRCRALENTSEQGTTVLHVASDTKSAPASDWWRKWRDVFLTNQKSFNNAIQRQKETYV